MRARQLGERVVAFADQAFAPALDAFEELGFTGGGETWLNPWILAAYAVVLLGCIAAEFDLYGRLRALTPVVLQPVAWVALIVFLTLFCPDDTAAFVYFQF